MEIEHQVKLYIDIKLYNGGNRWYNPLQQKCHYDVPHPLRSVHLLKWGQFLSTQNNSVEGKRLVFIFNNLLIDNLIEHPLAY